MYKVFFNNNTIFFSDKPDFSNLPFNTLAVRYIEDFPLEILEEKAKNEARKINYFILVQNLEEAFKKFQSQYKIIEAAGGIIFNSKNQFLGIYRRDKWDLPKGKVDQGEDIEAAAIRECQEETGLISLKIENKITETYHTYFQKKQILKRTHWYRMNLINDEPTSPQIEEEITKVKWFENLYSDEFTNNTFASILEVLKTS
jgi:ADP-ribose pyrophosphatase YjhB (NUDIX family)